MQNIELLSNNTKEHILKEVLDYFKPFGYTIHKGNDYLSKNNVRIQWNNEIDETNYSTPELFVEKEHAFIEVKSPDTRRADDYTIMKTKDACNLLGYNYFVITIISEQNQLRISQELFLVR
jgi:hypothetical protein